MPIQKGNPVKLRSLLPRRWREAPAAVALAVKPSNRAWSLEALEPRMLLSADPVLGAVHLALSPDGGGHVDALADAYAAAAPAGPAGPTMHALAVTLPGGGVTNPIIVPSGNYSFANDSMQVSGNLLIQTTDTTAGNGSISIGSFNHGDKLSGNSSATVDNLTLSAARNITINAEVNVGAGSTDLLSSLTILTAQNVTFNEAVSINGSLTIDATGIVTFTHGIS
ncbi:MAG: LEPR-XLL domain-containing protein, partial [Rubrivivax sp.]